jgi:hypothetical protein
MNQYPELKSFAQGYLVHCVSDQFDIPRLVQRKFPLSLEKDQMTPRQCTVILEFFNVLRVKPAAIVLSEKNNHILDYIGIGEEQALKFASGMNQFLKSPSLLSLLALYQNMGFASNGRIEKYQIAVRQFQKNWLRKHMILFGLNIGRINDEITALVKSNLPKEIVA